MRLKDLLHMMEEIIKQHHLSEAKVVGGTPRDKVMGRLDRISDLDITTGNDDVKVLAQELSNRLAQSYQIDTKVMNDGHISIFMGDLKVDFSSNFVVPNIDQLLQGMGIDHPSDIERELFSRDFTCNTLLMDFDLKTISDPTHRGLKDIKEKMIRTCLSPELTLTSNKNRVIRAIYLAAKLDFEIDPRITEWVKKNPSSVNIATPRVLTEKLNEALKYNGDKTIKLLDQMGLWEFIPITEALYAHYSSRAK